jgi:hypothetical protein
VSIGEHTWWLFCAICGWQTEQPCSAVAGKGCPNCRRQYREIMDFKPADWEKYGADLEAGKIRVADLPFRDKDLSCG